MDVKKLLVVIAFVILVGLLGFALYWVFFKQPAIDRVVENYNGGNIPSISNGNLNIVENQNFNQNEPLPWQEYLEDKVSPVAAGGLTQVTKITGNEVKGVVSSPTGLQYYDADTEQFYRINEKGEIELMSDQKFYQVEKVNWANSGSKAILEYPDGSNILYNFSTGKQITLPQELEDFDFNTAGNQITAKWIGTNEDNNWLVAANDDGSGMFLLEPLGDQSINTQMSFSPDNQVAALHRKYIDAQRQQVYPIGLHGENLKAFEVSGAGFVSEWSPEGNAMIYSVYHENTDYLPNLWVTKGNTAELGDVKISLNVATWPDKCTFSGENVLYCAVPQGMPRGAGMYPEIANDYPDNFYRINLETGAKTLIASPIGDSASYSANNLSISPDGSILYFMDQDSGSLQSIRLK